MSAPNENEVEAALALAERNDTQAHRETLNRMRRWIVPNVTSENDDMIASRILAAEVRRLRELEKESLSLLRFTGEVFHGFRGLEFGHIDGGDFQDIAERHGLLRQITMIEPCCDECSCAVECDFPLTCYQNTDLAQKAIRAFDAMPKDQKPA